MSQIKVLLAGATGQLGQLVAQELLKKSNISLRLLVRPGSAQKLSLPQTNNYEVVECELSDTEGLVKATEGIHTIVSTVAGPTGVEGQFNLFEAGKKSGIKRFSPSDYTSNLHKIDFPDHRKKINAILEERKGDIKLLHFLTGSFTDVMDSKIVGVIDPEEKKVRFWGTGYEPMDTTTYSDTAKFVAEVVADPEASGWFEFVAQVTSWGKFAETYSEVTGIQLEKISLGSLQDLEAKIEEEKKAGNFPFLLFIHKGIITGQATLDHPLNDKYPQIKPLSVKEFLTKKFSKP